MRQRREVPQPKTNRHHPMPCERRRPKATARGLVTALAVARLLDRRRSLDQRGRPYLRRRPWSRDARFASSSTDEEGSRASSTGGDTPRVLGLVTLALRAPRPADQPAPPRPADQTGLDKLDRRTSPSASSTGVLGLVTLALRAPRPADEPATGGEASISSRPRARPSPAALRAAGPAGRARPGRAGRRRHGRAPRRRCSGPAG
jgi:hypothetical protein